jgi:transcription initiation factor IIE alpha subunit
LLAAAPDTRKELCQPYPKDDLEAYEISTRVKTPPTTSRKLLNRLTTANQVSASSARANRRRWEKRPSTVAEDTQPDI